MSLSAARLGELLEPFLDSAILPEELYARLGSFVELLLRWNARTNLTAIRDPESIVTRHLGESLFLGLHLRPLLPSGASLLDFGSGAGFPGLPVQLLYPELVVTLAESQGKKAAFLREAVRVLNLNTTVWSGRVENLPEAQRFEAVMMRAVDDPENAVRTAIARLRPNGVLAALAGEASLETGLEPVARIPVPLSSRRFLELYRHVPRGTKAFPGELPS